MKTRLNELLLKGKKYIQECPEEVFIQKVNAEKWSKKEIVGHLIDSAINNPQRFAEIQFENKPFVIKKYNQTELVKANDYQHADTMHLLNFWLEINYRIQSILEHQNSDTLNFRIKLTNGEF